MKEPTRKRLLSCVSLLMVGAFAALNLSSWPARLLYPGDGNVGGDSMPLVDTVHLSRRIPIYAAASAERYDGANWGPLFYLFGSRIVNPQEPSYFPLRVLSIFGTL